MVEVRFFNRLIKITIYLTYYSDKLLRKLYRDNLLNDIEILNTIHHSALTAQKHRKLSRKTQFPFKYTLQIIASFMQECSKHLLRRYTH